MNDNQFYPTPKSLLDKIGEDFSELFNRFNRNRVSILEPSAGKGDIAEWLKKKVDSSSWGHRDSWSFWEADIDCIEIDRDLCSTLKGKHFRVVHDNFFSFDSRKRYDLIFMNPPFADGDKHLLKAISLQERYGGVIVCILNAETIRNPYTNARKELVNILRKYNATVNYYEEAFNSEDTERKTLVEVAVIGLDIPSSNILTSSLIFDKLDRDEEDRRLDIPSEDDDSREIIPDGLDWIQSYVRQYNEEVDAGITFIREYIAYESVRRLRFEDPEKSDGATEKILTLNIGSDPIGSDSLNTFIKRVRHRYWSSIFIHPEFTGKLTSKMRTELQGQVREMENYDFTFHNIIELLTQIRNNTLQGIEDSIMGLFDTLSSQYSYIDNSSENIHYYNGWKTNKAHKVNKKVIIPMYGVWDSWRWAGKTEWSLRDYQAINTLRDMAKALDYIADRTYANINTEDDIARSISSNFKWGNTRNIETKYFFLTFYKKGTCHIVFKDEKLLEKFNLFAGKQRQWLPPDYGKKPYTHLSEEEKTVADSFSGGETGYNEIYENQGQYLVERSSLMLLSSPA